MRNTESDQAFRVKIESLNTETGKVSVSYAGPYANRSTAKAQETRLRNDKIETIRIHAWFHPGAVYPFEVTYTTQESSLQGVDCE